MAHLAARLSLKFLSLLSYIMHVIAQQRKWIISIILQLRKSEAEKMNFPTLQCYSRWIGILN